MPNVSSVAVLTFCGSPHPPSKARRYYLSEVRNYAKSEVSRIDNPTKPTKSNVNVQESVENAKFYCKRYPDSFVSLRDYSGDVYNETCSVFAAEQQLTDSSYKIG